MKNNSFRLLLALFVLLSWRPAWGEEALCKIADNSFKEASAIRELLIKGRVPCELHNQEQVKRYLLHAIETKITPERLRYEELLYKAVGVIPEDFDYKDGMVQLYLSQLGGYYEPEIKKFIMASWLPAAMQTAVAVHELTHALQDQHFDLQKFVDHKRFDSDAMLARSAVVEGDATAVMIDYTRRLTGQRPLREEKNIESLLMQNVLGSALMAGADRIPLSLRLMLLFPYTSGLGFVHELLERGGYREVNSVYRRPPRSTEEVLHPEKYLTREADFEVPRPDELRAGPEETVEYSDVMGEFGVSALLSSYLADKQQAAGVAAGWAGDRIGLVTGGGAGRAVVWVTRWDTLRDAEEFERSYLEVLRKAHAGYEWQSGPEGTRGRGKQREITLRRDGRVVSARFSLP